MLQSIRNRSRASFICSRCLEVLKKNAVRRQRTQRRHRSAVAGAQSVNALLDSISPNATPPIAISSNSDQSVESTAARSSRLLSGAAMNTYTQSLPPTMAQLEIANQYFERQAGSYLFTASRFLEFPKDSNTPEITFLGRSNVGKSSLLNALFGVYNKELAYTSKKAGKTTAMQVFGIGQGGSNSGANAGGTRRHIKSGLSEDLMSKKDLRVGEGVRLENWIARGGLAVIDMPGYGKSARATWGVEAIKYLEQRKQLRRAFLLVNINHGLDRRDHEMLDLLREAGTPHQIVFTKVDKMLGLKDRSIPSEANLARRLQEVDVAKQKLLKETNAGGRGSVTLGDLLCTTSEAKYGHHRPGIDELRWMILQATGLSGGGVATSTASLQQRAPTPAPIVPSPPEEKTIQWRPQLSR